MGLGQKILLGQPSMVWVWVWKISPKKVKFFNFFPSGQKNLFGLGQNVPRTKAGWPLLLRVKSKLRVGQAPSLM